MGAKHTPGPWRIDGAAIWGATRPVAQCVFLDTRYPLESDEANVHLVAVAPDMLAILKEAADFVQPFNRASDLLDRIEAVIAKAEGRT
ncbi:hypothetical protein [Mesorhizobium sp.]|uniref:hypothetical protein n=1 Tax=Mesorhizobium sp. TaxID=1871066 RepID=UPI000FE7CE7F|nr:hypothetical protein [Mesorhizobium sp.]RWO22852.1 MAG: hypothetical protein EOS09_19485 [Mesorhizobium sp.]